MPSRDRDLPLVYSCSGCSSAAQMANYLAVQLDQLGKAEMSCIAGVGGNVPALVKLARSGRPILALDGCHLQCAKACLTQRGVTPNEHILLSKHGVKKQYRTLFDKNTADQILEKTVITAIDKLNSDRMSDS